MRLGYLFKVPFLTLEGKVWKVDARWGHSRLGYYFWVSNGKRTFLDNFTCLVCLDLYCEAYFGSYLQFILHIEYTDKVNLEGIGSSKISF
jgi:hypothetical protein